MAISTYKTYLLHKATAEGSYTKLVDIKDFPDLGGAPEMLETTTLSDEMQTNILGIQSLDSLEFTCNYTLTEFKKVKALSGKTEYFAVAFCSSPDTVTGDLGLFEFEGMADVFVAGAGVNEVVEMTVAIAASTPIREATTNAG